MYKLIYTSNNKNLLIYFVQESIFKNKFNSGRSGNSYSFVVGASSIVRTVESGLADKNPGWA